MFIRRDATRVVRLAPPWFQSMATAFLLDAVSTAMDSHLSNGGDASAARSSWPGAADSQMMSLSLDDETHYPSSMPTVAPTLDLYVEWG